MGKRCPPDADSRAHPACADPRTRYSRGCVAISASTGPGWCAVDRPGSEGRRSGSPAPEARAATSTGSQTSSAGLRWDGPGSHSARLRSAAASSPSVRLRRSSTRSPSQARPGRQRTLRSGVPRHPWPPRSSGGIERLRASRPRSRRSPDHGPGQPGARDRVSPEVDVHACEGRRGAHRAGRGSMRA